MRIKQRQRIKSGIRGKKVFSLQDCAIVYLIVYEETGIHRETNAKENWNFSDKSNNYDLFKIDLFSGAEFAY